MSIEGNLDQKKPHPRLGSDAWEQIGAHLQAVFAEIEGQPIPDEQVDLLLALRRAERERGRKEA
ncbi:NepR family anti-sigma factor [Microvirga calopogonii]|uniref:NepR family anti-sigma factor n=1 Tax=Microvirga calopogonii TaxID=2078013 RepID=UPI000E0E05BE|nr:NepR family anti-sigma factor [Microvirga calopogonii]